MSGVYIKGMEMPKGCATCVMNLDTVCYLLPEEGFDDSNGLDRRPNCPLVPVPDHGDLIDMSAKIDVFDRWDDDIIRPSTVRHFINEYISGGYPRTIIPADKEAGE